VRIDPRLIELKFGKSGDGPAGGLGVARYGRALLDPRPPEESLVAYDDATEVAPRGAAADTAEDAGPPTIAHAGPNDPYAGDDPRSDEPAQRLYTCPGCVHEFAVAELPAGGLLACPACGAEFFAVAEVSAEDRAELDRLELDRQVREQRLVGMKQNVVLLERRSLFRTRSYVILALAVCVVGSMQLTMFAARRFVYHGLSRRVELYLFAIGVLMVLAWLCVRKIWQLTEELGRPAQKDPVVPPDFSTLSDGSQVRDVAARNLERLTGGRA
jgi:hypothetical protein